MNENDQDFILEQKKLKDTLEIITLAKTSLEKSLEALGAANLDTLHGLRTDSEGGLDLIISMQKLHEKNEAFNLPDKYKRLEELNASIKEPYFARIDLKHASAVEEPQNFYIGKFGLSVRELPIITDWRAKVASVYYRYRYPQQNVQYITPAGVEVRDLTLKRTFEIDSGELVKYYNNDIQFDENEIIVDKINQRTGGVLEDIIETIQTAQLDIIESDPRQVCIVQGCVGSGKSTVAIHKLSHIFFNFPDLIHPERAILVAKNQILVSYLSTLFPKLGIFDINYKTLIDLIIRFIFAEEISLDVDFDDNTGMEAITLAHITQLDEGLASFHQQIKEEIQQILNDPEFESYAGFVYNDNQAVLENLSDLIDDLTEEIDLQKDEIADLPERSIKIDINKENIKIIRKLVKRLNSLKAKIKEKHFNKFLHEFSIPKTGKLTFTQCLIYVYVHLDIFGFNKFKKYEYCVVDEGQDLSILEYLVLGKLVINGRFCILGDLNQAYATEGLSTWEEIASVIKEARSAITFELDTNYRSTKPIIELANNILAPYTKEYLPKSINRKGSAPAIEMFESSKKMISAFEKALEDDLASLDKSIGVICYQDDLFSDVHAVCSKLLPNNENLVILDSKKEISYLPKGVYLAKFSDCKGLEFSKVYVLGLDLGKVESFKDAKKAFVAVTRAMNELALYGVTDKIA